jgi:hypothetical protein
MKPPADVHQSRAPFPHPFNYTPFSQPTSVLSIASHIHPIFDVMQIATKGPPNRILQSRCTEEEERHEERT